MKVDTARLKAKLEAARDGVPDAVQRARKEAADDLLDFAMPGVPLSVKRYPSDPPPGELRSSGYVEHFSPEASEVGFSAPYALIVHEMGPGTNWSTPGTGAKFLESPFAERKGLYVKRMREAARGELRG